MAVNFNCSMCYFSCCLLKDYKNHIVRLHQHDPNFIVHCVIKGCAYTTKSWNAYKLHLRRSHACIDAEVNEPADTDHTCLGHAGDADETDNDLEMEVDNESRLDQEMKTSFANANFLLALEGKHRMSKVGLDSVVSTLDSYIQQHVDTFKAEAKSVLRTQGLDETVVDGIHVNNMMHNFSSDYKRKKFYTKHCHLVNPIEIVLGSALQLKHGRIMKLVRTGCYIPFIESLVSLLEMPEVKHFVENPHQSHSDFMYDVVDGEYIREHPLFIRNPRALQIFLHTDDIEVVNPLGSHVKKHKLCMFYYTIGNIPPMFRSRLAAIQLLAIARTNDVKKFGMKILLQDFISSIGNLSHGGVTVQINQQEYILEGTLVMAQCDTPAANWVGGFKEGVSFAFKCCRMCDIVAAQLSQHLSHNTSLERDPELHKERCRQLEDLSPRTKLYWSKMWGINSNSVLAHIPDFQVTKCLVQDPMHVLLEGIIRCNLRLLLVHCIQDQKLFSLDWLNTRMKNFQYPLSIHKSMPEPIDAQALKHEGKMKQTAAAMLTLICVLPYLVGDKVPEGNTHWDNFIRLLKITLLSTSPYADRDTADQLSLVIHDYLCNFMECYPDAPFVPKMHYLTHFPVQLLRFGPLRHQCCMRFEAKHAFFKDMRLKNFKNLPLSLANKLQFWLCHMQLGANGERSDHYIYAADTVAGGKTVSLALEYGDVLNDLRLQTDVAYRTCKIEIHGLVYSRNKVIVLGYKDLPQTPLLGLIHDLLVIDNEKYFIFKELTVHRFHQHLNSYEVSIMHHPLNVIKYNKLQFKWPHSMHLLNGNLYVMLQYTHKNSQHDNRIQIGDLSRQFSN